MQDDRLDAIAKFATDEDYGLISEAELREHAPSWHAAQRLLEYLKQDFDTEPNPAAIDTGRHVSERAHRRGQLYCPRIDVAAGLGRRINPARADRGFLRPSMACNSTISRPRNARKSERAASCIWWLGDPDPEGNLLMFSRRSALAITAIT
jgi:hypothetical protein